MRTQADKPLTPSVNYRVKFYRFRTLYGYEIVSSEITLPLKKADLHKKKLPKRTQKQRVPQAMQYTLSSLIVKVLLLGTPVT